jgi:Tir chaperone protein (CesT) family
MEPREQVELWLKELSEQFDAEFSLDADGVCALISDEGNPLYLELVEDSASLSLFTDLFTLPDHADPQFLRALLAVNLLGLRTGGATIGLDVEQNSLILSQWVALAVLDAEKLSQLLLHMSSVADRIRAEFQPLLHRTSPAGESSETPAVQTNFLKI